MTNQQYISTCRDCKWTVKGLVMHVEILSDHHEKLKNHTTDIKGIK